ncbi:HepT-like ribonuclease domain-containing protein [Rhizobium sp. FY34]|uniref:HepT-like ribonuclease domain-containing protein n=1 Tax=Rhizobium sp. FY34 TaxID=2562309 RepID=UPI001FEDD47C|nr:HepT-like ribonuclease domain-containing protein [Rhizobium sp. FY34]
MSRQHQALLDAIEQMEEAVEQAMAFVAGMDKHAFLADVKTQMAVSMAFIIMGESVSRILAMYPHIADDHGDIPWQKIKGMRNLVAHEYFELEFDAVWMTVHDDLPPLLSQLRMLRQIRAQGE